MNEEPRTVKTLLEELGYYDVVIHSVADLGNGVRKAHVSYKWKFDGCEKTVETERLWLHEYNGTLRIS